jgi:sialidase-1
MLKIFNKLWGMVLVSILLGVITSSAQDLNYVFKSGEEGYACFRIPAIVKSKSGVLLAFAEGRKNGCGDAGDINLVLKRSFDDGKTWSGLEIVWDDSTNTCGNPAPIVDQKTGDIVLLSTWNLGTDHEPQIINLKSKDTRRIFLLRSSDEGVTWSSAKEITAQVKLPNWTWYATGPCNGIQLSNPLHPNRMVIPCDHIEAVTNKYFSHVIYSDDAGLTWNLGGSTPTDQVNECTVVELPNYHLLLNMRNYNKQRVRQTSISSDAGITWSPLQPDTTLIEPVCQASMIAYKYKRKNILVFSNPADSKTRKNLTVRFSYDAGQSWEQPAVLYNGPAAYSNLVYLGKGLLACYYEAGIASAYEGIVYQLVKSQKNILIK